VSASRELVTERLVLRPWTLDDARGFHEVWGDPRVIFWGPAASPEHSRRILARVLQRVDGRPWPLRWFGVRSRETGAVVGSACLQPAPWDPSEVEIGWHLAHAAWGHGYATETGRALLELAFAELANPRVVCAILPSNARSLAVAARLGFRRYQRDVPRAGWLHDLFEVRSSAP
jgi:[ribosomal protein S5]-alanine N-acetyltransferase